MIVRAKRNTNFTTISNVGMEDARLTFKAKGILAYLLSKPDNWQVRDRQLATVGPDGRAAVQAALRELETHGYIKRIRERNEQGQWVYTSYVYDEPWLENPSTDKPRSEKPAADKPSTGKPAADNRAIISTVVTNTDLTNTDLTNTEEEARARAAPPPDVLEEPEPPSEPEPSRDVRETKALVDRLHHVGSPATPHIVDTYMELAKEVTLENVLRGLTAAAEQGKQYSTSYVTACARNAQRGDSSGSPNGASHRGPGSTNGLAGRNSRVGQTMAAFDEFEAMLLERGIQ